MPSGMAILRQAFDSKREVFCLLMEDLNEAGYAGGDQLTGGPSEGPVPLEFMQPFSASLTF